MRLAFEGYVLDAGRRELRHGSELIAVEPQVFDLLLYLAQNPDRVIGRDELLRAVWHGRFVSDSAVTNRITAARRAIGDSGEAQRLIRTVQRRGIRFIGRVEEVPAGGVAPSRHHFHRKTMWLLIRSAILGAAIAIIITRSESFFSRGPADYPAEPTSVLVSTLPVKSLGASGDHPGLPGVTVGEPALRYDAPRLPAARASPTTAKPNRDSVAVLPAAPVLAAVHQDVNVSLPDAAVTTLRPIQHFNPLHHSDGTYSGALTVKSDNHPGRWSCGYVDLNRTMTIEDGRFSLLFDPTANVVLKGEVDAAGKLMAWANSPQGGAAFEGAIQGRALTGDITSAYCVFGLRLSRVSD